MHVPALALRLRTDEENDENVNLHESSEDRVLRIVEQFLLLPSAKHDCHAFFISAELPDQLRVLLKNCEEREVVKKSV